MDKKPYDPSDIERKLYQEWEDSGIFEPGDGSDSYSLAIPPPNVTGTLHMGHGFQNAIMDCLIRYYRMSGKNTLWQVGTDHAGIATEMVVERRLNAEGKSKNDIGREAFEKEVWNWKKYSGNKITSQLRRLGSSLDWSTERFTLDDEYQHAVLSAFIQLFEEGLIYQGKRLVNWDPVLETSLSDLEVINKELTIKIWEIKYQLEGTDEFVTIATTRPETMLGDTAIAVNPKDKRYKECVGKTVTIPIVGRKIKIIKDNYADPEQGTGALKITPAHDFNDFEVGRRQSLDVINVLDRDAHINENAPDHLRGLDRYEARDAIVKEIEGLGLLEKIEENLMTVPYGDRSGVVIEPWLTDQWFVDAEKVVGPALDVVRDGTVTIMPESGEKTYYHWLDNIEPWCISRQLWWGHQIPVWYASGIEQTEDNPFGEVAFCGTSLGDVAEQIRAKYGDIEVLEVTTDNAHYGSKNYVNPMDLHLTNVHSIQAGKGRVGVRRDPDVLDTWFSSGLWPIGTLGWPNWDESTSKYFSTDVLVTGQDILFFWVARMMFAGQHFMGAVPFLAAATMVEAPVAKGPLYVCSTFVGLSRMTDNAHYPSQSFLGWYLAFASAMAVNDTEMHFVGMQVNVMPIPLYGGGSGMGKGHR